MEERLFVFRIYVKRFETLTLFVIQGQVFQSEKL